MVLSPHLSVPCPVCCTCNFTKSEWVREEVGGPSFVFQGNSGKRRGGGNGIFYFPHNPDVGKKKDFLWVAAITLIFYADKIFPPKKKKRLWENHTTSAGEATATLTFALRRERKKRREFYFCFTVFFLTVPSGHRERAGLQRGCEAGAENYRIQRALETPPAPSLLAATVSLRSDAAKTNPDWPGPN